MNGIRIAMWSGPRNISTAMMRAWENRPDTVVSDEPLYAHYLAVTGIEHPGREEVLASQSIDAAEITRGLAGAPPGGAAIWYQKHMTQHMLPDVPLDWFGEVRHAFLIRAPEAVAASFTAQRPDAAPRELGFEQQWHLFERVCDLGGTQPPVVDAADVLRQPETTLRALCAALDVPFSAHMLAWPAGPRDSDGVWAPYWYASVEKSTGFAAPDPRPIELTPTQQRLADACRPWYERLSAHRLAMAGIRTGPAAG